MGDNQRCVLYLLMFLLLGIVLPSNKVLSQSCSTSSVLARWDFDHNSPVCNGATVVPPQGFYAQYSLPSSPMLGSLTGYPTFCPQINSGCGQALLSSKGHVNTNHFSNGLCLWNFYAPEHSANYGGVPFDVNSTVFNVESPANIFIKYTVPQGKAACINSFSLKVKQVQFTGVVNFQSQAVAVKRNGVVVYNQMQTITAANILGTPMTFNFTGNDFCTDGNSSVTYEIIFGLVKRLATVNDRIGYDDIVISGSCNPISASAEAVAATCGSESPLSNGQLKLSNYKVTDRYDFNQGAIYTGGRNFFTATPIPPSGLLTSTLPDPSTPSVYTIRLFSATGCYVDKSVTLNPAICQVACVAPTTPTLSTVTATCTGLNPNNDARISVSGVTVGNRVGYSLGSAYTGPTYTNASMLSGGTYLFSGLPNPAASEEYTVRVFNGHNTCYIDAKVTLNSVDCSVPCVKPTSFSVTATGATCTGPVPNNNASIAVTGVVNGDKVGMSIGVNYTGADYTTASALTAGAFTFSALPNPSNPTFYTIRVFNGNNTCYIDQTVVLSPVICNCTTPSGMTVTAVKATCSGLNPQDNASVTVTGVMNGNRVGISAGSSYVGPIFANAQVLTAGAYTFTNLPNPVSAQYYTVRIFNAIDGCYTDRTVQLQGATCGACIPLYIEVVEASTPDPDSSPNNSKSEDDKQGYEMCKNGLYTDLEVTKTVNTTTGTICPTHTDFIWTVTIRNVGTMTAKEIIVSDLMPQPLMFVSSSTTLGSYYRNSGWLIDSLQPAQTATLTITTKATRVGTFTNAAYVSQVYPDNDIDSSPNNDYTANEDDDGTATITVTGNDPPLVEKGFSPMLGRPNVPARLSFRLTNPSSTPITLTADFVDTLPSSPAQMVIASTPNITSDFAGVLAVAGDTKLTVPSGTILLPGLNQFSVDIVVPSSGIYRNGFGIGSFQTSACNNVEADTAAFMVEDAFALAPILRKSITKPTVNVNDTSTYVITIENRNAFDLTLTQDLRDELPTGLVAETGSATSTCGTVTLLPGDTILTLATGTVLPPGTCTMTFKIRSATAGIYCNRIVRNALLTEGNSISNLGNEDISESCLVVTNTPCTSLDVTTISASDLMLDPGQQVNLTSFISGLNPSTRFTWAADQGNFANAGIANTTWSAPMAPGLYTINFKADNFATGFGNCNDTTSIALRVASCALVLTPSSTNVTCFGLNNGTASVAISGNVDPVTYTWSNGASTNSVTGLAPGTYTVTVYESATCEDIASVTITQPAAALAASCAKTDVTTFGANDGTATVTPSGGTPAYTYLWSNGANAASISNLAPGNYSVNISDSLGCTPATCNITITQPCPPSVCVPVTIVKN